MFRVFNYVSRRRALRRAHVNFDKLTINISHVYNNVICNYNSKISSIDASLYVHCMSERSEMIGYYLMIAKITFRLCSCERD